MCYIVVCCTLHYDLTVYLSFSDKNRVELERSVAASLKALYLNENTVIVHRFWEAMLEALTKFVEKGAYCLSCSELQVGGYFVHCNYYGVLKDIE